MYKGVGWAIFLTLLFQKNLISIVPKILKKLISTDILRKKYLLEYKSYGTKYLNSCYLIHFSFNFEKMQKLFIILNEKLYI